VGLAVRQPFVIEEGTTLEFLSAVPADEAIRMPLAVERRYVILHDGAIASAALWRKHIEVILPAVGLAVPLVKAVLAELLAALSAEEVFRVPRLLERCHAFIENRSVAIGATGREEIVVVGLAVGMSLALEEIASSQFLIAVGASEVLGVPRLAEGGDDLADDRLLASVAASLLGRVDTLATHVRL